MATTWPPNFPVLQEGAERFAEQIRQASEGRMIIEVFASGELVPPLEIFESVSSGSIECGCAASYYWPDKVAAAQWFCAVPFGLNAQGMNAWFYAGGGLALWEAVYAPFNLVPRPYANTGVQMGGWFRKEMMEPHDWKGLKMRIPGLGGKVVERVGGKVVLLAAADIFANLERGSIDAAEWIGPLHDLRMGLYRAARYYYYPGWHEPGTVLEMMFNKQAYDSLPSDLKAILDGVAMQTNLRSLSLFEAQNGAALEELTGKYKVELRRFPAAMLERLRSASEEVLENEASRDSTARRVHDAFTKFKNQIGPWGTISEKPYYEGIMSKHALGG